MPDKLTDNEIIKALECCSEENKCKQCPYYNKGNFKCLNYKFFKDLLDIINRLQGENKKFKDRQKPTGASGYKIENGKVVFFTNMLGGYRYEYKDLDEVVKTLNELLHEAYSKNEIVFALKCKTEELKTAKAEAYKEFAELCKQKGIKVTGGRGFEGVTTMTTNVQIDNLLKELVGEDK